MPRNTLALPSCLVVLVALATNSFGAERVDFAEEIRPLFNKHCVGCHGGVKKASGVSFLSREQALAEAKSGLPPIVAGEPNQSELLRRIASDDPNERMPPPDHGAALSATEQSLLKRWIEEGAEWKGHWAFEAPNMPAIPETAESSWSQGPLDRFVKARLEALGKQPSERADPEELLRRVALDVTGLPPSLEQLATFRANPSAEIYARLVDEFLASPHFGERWAGVWMDVARYADSEGLGIDRRRQVWKYRDWLVNAFNADKPFDVFVMEQLAGDLMPTPNVEQLVATTFHRLSQSNNEGGTDDEEFRVMAVIDRVNTTWESLQGITFGCVQCHAHPYDPIQHQEYYEFMAFFNNTADADVGEGYPKLAVPLDSAHYQIATALQARAKALREALHADITKHRRASDWKPVIFTDAKSSTVTSVEISGNDFRSAGNMSNGTEFTLDFQAPDAVEKITALRIDLLPRDPETALHTPEWGAVLSRIKLEWSPKGDGKFQEVKLREVLGDEPSPFYEPNESLKKGGRGFGAYSKQFRPRQGVVLLEKPLAVTQSSPLRLRLRHEVFALGAFPLVTKHGRLWLSSDASWNDYGRRGLVLTQRNDLKRLGKRLRSIPSTTVPVTLERPGYLARETRLFERGNWLEKGKTVTAGTPRSFPAMPTDTPRNRLALAEWFVSPDNPLTARVMVNRLWEQLFGRGLVETLEDFGSAGSKPSHPELLDYLARRLQDEHQWSVKRTLREMLLSATYQQTSRVAVECYEADPSNRMLARGPRQRLTAEMVRDHALAVAGLLAREMHGPPVHPPIPGGVWKPFDGGDKWPTAKPGSSARYRRAVYTYWKRSIPYPMFATFDAPSREVCLQRRLPSNTPLQALTLLNDAVFDECAQELARKMNSHSDQLDQQLRHGFLLATSSYPNADILMELRSLHTRLQSETQADATEALRNIASVLLNLDAALSK